MAILAINMIHIAPWSCCEALLDGAERLLPSGGVVYLYGPYKRAGEHTAASNAAFDIDLRQRNAEWGVRNLEDVVAAGGRRHLYLSKTVEMPANNLSLIFSYQPG